MKCNPVMRTGGVQEPPGRFAPALICSSRNLPNPLMEALTQQDRRHHGNHLSHSQRLGKLSLDQTLITTYKHQECEQKKKSQVLLF